MANLTGRDIPLEIDGSSNIDLDQFDESTLGTYPHIPPHNPAKWTSRATSLLKDRNFQRRYLIPFGLLAALVTSLGIGFGVAGNKAASTSMTPPAPSGPTLFPTFSPSPKSRYSIIRSIVESLSGANVLDEAGSPQNDALNWIVFSDTKQVPPDSDTLLQRYSLAVFYYSTKGEQWTIRTGWLGPNDECSWNGITCESEFVTKLVLPKNNMSGKLPPEISALDNTVSIELYSNDIQGSIPESIGEMTSMKKLYINKNQITNTIPKTLGDMTSLEKVAISDNLLIGALPSEIGKLVQLKTLELYNNNLSGKIPNEVGNMSLLEKLYLDTNRFKGPIPSSIGKLMYLEDLRVQKNSLTGNIPDDLYALTSLANLFLFENDMKGSLSSKIGELTNLSYLYVNDNKFSSTIPSQMANLARLTSVTLQDNKFTGTVPELVCEIDSLDFLKIDCSDNTMEKCVCCTCG